jgi:Cu+-exporting ATPase
VQASWFCTDATLLIEATRKGTHRAIDGVAAAVTHAQGQKKYAPSQSERVAAVFAPVVMAVAIGTFLVWSILGTWDEAILNALAVCLVACPCAFGFAAPIGLRAGTLRLASAGIVVRQSAALDALARVDRVLFDKTGTLTATCIDPGQTYRFAHQSWPTDALLGLAAAAQSLVHHPISAAFAPWGHLCPPGWQPVAAKLLPGCGIEVTMMGPQGEHRVHLGEPSSLLSDVQTDASAQAQAMLNRGHKPLALLLDGTCLALFALKDSPFVPPIKLMEDLSRRGIASEILSGDNPVAVAALGIKDAQASLTPAQKLQHVQAVQASSSVCFLGDGINDSAAMCAADVAVSMQSGADLAIELADLTLPAGKPQCLLMAIDTARTTTRLIRQNLLISLSYNTIGMAVAAAGLLNPVGAALLMAVSSLTVSARSLAMLKPQSQAANVDGATYTNNTLPQSADRAQAVAP